MAIDLIEFGKNLRPSTVEVMNKLNEVIGVLNSGDFSEIEDLKESINSLNTSVNNLSTQIEQLQGLEQRVQANETDIEKIKITLYTPLEPTEQEI